MTLIKNHWQLLLITLAIYALWSTPVVYPLRLLTVFFHELSHLLMALLTGGQIESMHLDPYEGGEVWARGGSRFWTLTAGYLGSLGIGAALFLLALRSHWDRFIMGALGATMVVIAALYLREGFGLGFAIGMGAVMALSAWFLPRAVNDLALRIIGLTSMLYAPNDIISDTITRQSARSDARMLAEEFGGATVLWGGLWLMLSLGVIALVLRYGLGHNSNLSLRWSQTWP